MQKTPDVRFVQLTIETVHLFPAKSMGFLRDACNETGSYMSVDMAFQQFYQGVGYIFTVYIGNEVVGCIQINYQLSNAGKILNIILLGGERLEEWFSELEDFLTDLAQKTECSDISLIGRKGWGRIFKSLQPLQVIYRKQI